MKLELRRGYTRMQVHGLSGADAPFNDDSPWKWQGILPVPGGFAFFTTLGQGKTGFDTGISPEGVVRWQSQKHMGFANEQIKKFIRSEESNCSIYLFLRTSTPPEGKGLPYYYMGKLKYLWHHPKMEKPVHFNWQLLDWPVPETDQVRIGLKIEKLSGPVLLVDREARGLTPVYPPGQGKYVKPDYVTDALRKLELGLQGELAVLDSERRILMAEGKMDLAGSVCHVSADKGDNAGYDILSFFPDGRTKYIEVKTTKGPLTLDFFISANEVEFSKQNAGNYVLMRVFEFDPAILSGKAYSIPGNISDTFALTPVKFRVSNLIV